MYAVDLANVRVQKFNGSGDFLSQWGDEGDGEGQFRGPLGITVDRDENVYVIDSSARIQKFNASGNFLTQWGSRGGGEGQFRNPRGIAVDSEGNLYVADSGNGQFKRLGISDLGSGPVGFVLYVG